MRIILVFFCLFFSATHLKAQTATALPTDTALIELKQLATDMINGILPEKRQESCRSFIPKLVQYLKTDNSFQKDLSSISEISILYPPDKSFRILTWAIEATISNTGAYKTYSSVDELIANPLEYTYYGVIQFNTPTLTLIPLEDKSAEMEKNAEDLILDNRNWYGAIYYNIHEFNLEGKKCYALFGWDGNTGISTRKLMDILTIEDKKVSFGLPIIDLVRDDERMVKNRFIHEFRAGSGVSLNYDTERKMVVYDFIEAPEPESKGIYPTYIPDGTYSGLEFKNGKWTYIERVKGNDIDPEQLLIDREASQKELSSKNKNKKSKKKNKKKK